MNEVAMQIEVGVLRRRAVRAHLDFRGLDYNEHKGLLSSIFVAKGSREVVLLVAQELREWMK